MPDLLLGLAPRPVFLGAILGAPDGLLTTYDRLKGRDTMGTHHWLHQTHVWYRLALLGAGAGLELTNTIGTDASTTMMLTGLYGLAARYGNYLHSVVHPAGSGGGGEQVVRAQGRLREAPPAPIEADPEVLVMPAAGHRRVLPLAAAGSYRRSALPAV